MKINNKVLLLVTICLASTFSGCTSNPYQQQLEQNPNYPILDSECDINCRIGLNKQLSVHVLDFPRANISRCSLHKINNIVGVVKWERFFLYNDTWSGGFEVPVVPGMTRLDIYPIYTPVKAPGESIMVHLEARHRYFVGQFLVTPYGIGNKDYSWFPIVFDKTDAKVIFPKGEIFWLPKK